MSFIVAVAGTLSGVAIASFVVDRIADVFKRASLLGSAAGKRHAR